VDFDVEYTSTEFIP